MSFCECVPVAWYVVDCTKHVTNMLLNRCICIKDWFDCGTPVSLVQQVYDSPSNHYHTPHRQKHINDNTKYTKTREAKAAEQMFKLKPADDKRSNNVQ